MLSQFPTFGFIRECRIAGGGRFNLLGLPSQSLEKDVFRLSR
jgi:hypothetical protein